MSSWSHTKNLVQFVMVMVVVRPAVVDPTSVGSARLAAGRATAPSAMALE